jgi:hypothetical protein
LQPEQDVGSYTHTTCACLPVWLGISSGLVETTMEQYNTIQHAFLITLVLEDDLITW